MEEPLSDQGGAIIGHVVQEDASQPVAGTVLPPSLTPDQATYLIRWGLGELAITRLDATILPLIMLSTVLAVGAGLLAALVAHGGAAVMFTVFAVLFGLSALVTFTSRLGARRLIRHLAVPGHLRPAFAELSGVRSRWRRNLRAELRRVGLPDGAFALFSFTGRLGRARGVAAAELGALRDLKLEAVFDVDRLIRAQRVFDQAQASHSAARG